MKKILLLEDDINLRQTLALEFSEREYLVYQADKLSSIIPEVYDYAVLDLRLKNERGIDAIEFLLRLNNNCKIVILTGFGSIATSVESIKRGAVDYLTKPITFEKLENVLLGKLKDEELELSRLSLSENEYYYIQYVLHENAGNITKAAKELGLHRQSLQRKLRKLP